MIVHENCLLADNSHEISYLIFSKIRKDVGKIVVCCSCDWVKLSALSSAGVFGKFLKQTV